MESFTEIIKSDKPTLVDFNAAWCAPCKAMTPILEQLKGEMHDKLRILKVDIDKNQEFASKLQVKGVPTFIIYKSGKRVWRESGAMSLENLMLEIQKHL